MKIKLILLLVFLISCGSETSTENLNQVDNDEDEYLEEEYEEDSDEEEYEEDSDEEEYEEDSDEEEYEEDSDEEEYEEDSDEESLYDEYGEWDKGTTYFDTSSSTSTGWYMGQGTDREEHVHEGMQTLDGGFIAIGHHWEKEEDPTGFTDMIILKTDSKGNELWQTIIGTPDKFDVGYAVNELSDGYVAGGGLYKDGFQKSAIVKLDFNGNIVWQKIFTHNGVGGIRGIEVIDNDEIVVTGYKEGDEEGFLFISDGSKGFIKKMSTDGEVIWDKDLSAMQGTKVKQTSKGGFVVGSVEWVDEGLNASMHYLDPNGNTLSTKLFGGNNNVQLFDMDITSNDYVVFTGHTTGYQTENWDCIVMLIDDQGNEVWKNIFGNPRGYDPKFILDECYGVRETLDGGFVVTGGTGDHSDYSGTGHPNGTSDDWKILLSEFDKDGNMTSINVFGGGLDKGNDAGEFIDVTSDGGYIIFSDTDSKGLKGPNNFGFLYIKNS
ncbi:hypothetical protein OAY98_00130 [Acidimicrobiaceae bacterium]|nr:hypothetical protein [Acidimicrobiaceae bacterium]